MEPAKMVEAMVEAVEAEPMPSGPMPATPCMPDSRAGEEQRCQHNDDPHPLLLGLHGDSLPLMICGGALFLALDSVRWPFDADRLRHLPISHVNGAGQAHLTACPDGEGDKPFRGHRKADHAVVRHPLLRRKTGAAVPSDVPDRPEHVPGTDSHRPFAPETLRSAGGFPDDSVGVKSDSVFHPACRLAAKVRFMSMPVGGWSRDPSP